MNINIDKHYVIAATGYLQNGHEIGHGYEKYSSLPFKQANSNNLTWKFKAPNVHDFVWAADPDYIHNSKQVRKGLVLHSFYKIDTVSLKKQFESVPARMRGNSSLNSYINSYKMQWDSVLELAARALPFIDQHYGEYPTNNTHSYREATEEWNIPWQLY